MLAVRANEKAASAAGVNVVRTKILAFAIAAFIAGLGGALLAYQQGNVTDDSFGAFLGLSVFATAYLGGITSVSGAMVAGLCAAGGVLVTFGDKFTSVGSWYAVLAGLGLIFMVVKNPEGIVGPVHSWLDRRRLGKRGDEVVAGTAKGLASVMTAPNERAHQASAAGVVSQKAALSVSGVSVSYGGVCAVSEVSFVVHERSITGLIGPNGAGKTTLLDAVSGFVQSDGELQLGTIELSAMKPHARAACGLGRTFQSIELYEDLTVLENVVVGKAATRGRHPDSEETGFDLRRTLDLLGLSPFADRPASELSQGTRQLVSIARALAGQPSVLLLDEPAAGLDPSESRWLGQRLRDLRETGVAILLVDHDLQLVLDLCDEIQVLDFGRLIASGTPDQVRNDPLVRAAYIGTRGKAADAGAPTGPAERPVRLPAGVAPRLEGGSA
jgi:ABC-type branched-subunit amino acid transport system ATPase component